MSIPLNPGPPKICKNFSDLPLSDVILSLTASFFSQIL